MNEHGRTHAHVYVSRHVQSIYYQATTRDIAHDRDVDGWVKNLSDGRVEAVFKGPRDDVEAMVGWCHERSSMAIIEGVDVIFEEPDGGTGFHIER